tara:strand:+ start:102 stop:299 length:198 start_codon:yes stop_codon:yes gene_type:complete
MKTENILQPNNKKYKVEIHYYGSDAKDLLFFWDKKKAFDTYDSAYRDSCVWTAYLFSPSGKLIYN